MSAKCHCNVSFTYVIMISTKNLINSKNERFREKSRRRFLFAKNKGGEFMHNIIYLYAHVP